MWGFVNCEPRRGGPCRDPPLGTLLIVQRSSGAGGGVGGVCVRLSASSLEKGVNTAAGIWLPTGKVRAQFSLFRKQNLIYSPAVFFPPLCPSSPPATPAVIESSV